MFVIAGLGNPGRKYENTRHNMGFLVIDMLAEKNGIKVNKIKHKALVGDGFISGQKVLLIKPQTYMNLSGESLREVVHYYNIDMEKLIVIYDDFDLEAGTIRIRKKGSAGSHNGMKSIIYQLQDQDFPRVRVGIGKSGDLDWKDFVLGKADKKDTELMSKGVEKAAGSIECILEEGIDRAMNRYNEKKAKPKKTTELADEAKPKETEGEQQGND